MENNKPNIFIGSSVEAINIAEAIQENLQYTCNVEVWSQGTFKPSSTTLDDLINTLERFDYGLFIFAPDDLTKLRDKTYNVVRDNVIFEMGLFIGGLGKERTFYVKPNNEEVHLPTDLLGFTPLQYDSSHPNLIASVGPVSTAIKRRIKELGKRK